MAEKITTPYYDHLVNFPNVYEPSEDTFLMMDTLESELKFLRSLQATFVAEIGSGSGVNITALCEALGGTSHCIATDINLEACYASNLTAKKNLSKKCEIDICQMSFLDMYRCKFDVIIFNPPYVPSENCELDGVGLSRAWAGGPGNGRLIIDVFLKKLPQLLNFKGVLYLLTIKENEPDKICDSLISTGIFTAKIISERKIRGEHLFVLKIVKIK